MPKIMPCLWFDGQAEEAARFYVTLFKDAEIRAINRMPDGTALTVMFRLRDQEFMALNGGPQYHFTEAVSFSIDCADQTEVDYFWDGLTADGGVESMCAWCKDKYGLSWQVVPKRLVELLGHPDGAARQRAMQAMFKMRKIDVAALEKAAAGG